MNNVLNERRWTREILAYISILLGVVLFTRFAHAGEMDILVNKLVEKGILTPGEAQTVLTETREEVRKEIAQGKSATLPEWIQNTKFKGDFRFREQYEQRDGSQNRWRPRIRYRLGIETKVNDRALVGFRISSGGSDARSTNQTLGESFSGKGVRLDQAYGQYTPVDWLTLVAGKMPNPIWNVSQLFWDSDITPEGGAILLNYKPCDNLALFLNTEVGYLAEYQNEGDDPFMFALQPGFEYKFKDKDNKDLGTWKGAFVYYNFIHQKGKRIFAQSSGTNSTFTTGTGTSAVKHYKYSYDAVGVVSQLGAIPPPVFIVPYAGVFGEFYCAPDPKRDNLAWLLGLMFGDEKVKERGQWTFKYSFRRLERDGIMDIFPDSDFFSGQTNVRGHWFQGDYGLSKNMYLELSYFKSKQIRATNPKDEDLLQFDWNFKF
jgi:hypothetical protein